MLPDKEHNTYLSEGSRKLLQPANIQEIKLTREWAKGFPPRPGVYALWNKRKLCYVGETGNIQKRMLDMLDSRNHCLRRTLGAELFNNIPGYTKADSKTEFPSDIEEKLERYIKQHLGVTYLEKAKIAYQKAVEGFKTSQYEQVFTSTVMTLNATLEATIKAEIQILDKL